MFTFKPFSSSNFIILFDVLQGNADTAQKMIWNTILSPSLTKYTVLLPRIIALKMQAYRELLM